MVHRHAVSSRVHLHAARRTSAVHRLCARCARLSRLAVAGRGRRMKLAGLEVGLDRPLFLIAGPCVIESEALVQEVAGRLKEITTALGIPLIFKASFDKANRSSRSSFRGHGLERGLAALESVQRLVKP